MQLVVPPRVEPWLTDFERGRRMIEVARRTLVSRRRGDRLDLPPDTEGIPMRKSLSIAFTLAALISALPILSACHTTAGAGQDVSATGNAVTDAAHKLTP
jgi:predicted small secreted protein